jgi:hypothetical protein
MTFDEDNAETGHSRTRGPLERITFPKEDSGEKSLLEFIEERSTESSRDEASEDFDSTLSKDLDDFDAESRPELDHMMIRLGGNGF